MEPLTVGIIGMVAVVGLVVMGMHIAFATAVVGLLGTFWLRGLDPVLALSGYLPWSAVAKYGFSALPMFILMGYLAYYGGLSEKAYSGAKAWFGQLKGGLAIASTFGCAIFAASSGASTAACAVMGKIAIPEMKNSGYSDQLATGVVVASGTLASLIPPSVLIVIYGIITEESVGALLIAGVIPGIVSAIIYALMIYVWAHVANEGTPIPSVPWKTKFKSLPTDFGGVAIIFGVVIFGIYTGVFTPTEAGGMAAFAALIIGLFKRKLTWNAAKISLLETASTTIMLFAIIVGVLFFLRFLALSGAPRYIAEMVSAWPVSRVLIMIGFLAIYIVLGCFMNPAGMMMLTVPVVLPTVVSLGYDPIWFGIIVIKMCEVSFITPPIGLNIYVVQSVAPKIPLQSIILGAMPFLAMDLLTVALFFVFPQIILWLPSQMMG
jgi:tripartite ATP-independent transporter DctM subunit